MMDAHDQAALAHFLQLIEAHTPPQLAVALAAARYQVALMPPLRDQLVRVQEAHPDLKRDVGRTVAAIDRRETISSVNSRKR